MSQPNQAEPPQLRRLPSGVQGLDAILRGGFLGGGVYIVRGTPGTGKTTFGHQLCFAEIARGGRALYATLLAEGHSRMMLHLGGMSFFRAEAVPDSLRYLSGFKTLEEDGLRGLVGMLRREISRLGAGVAIVDGLVAAANAAHDENEFKRFVHDLQAIAGLSGCTIFLLTSAGAGEHAVTPEQTMVDGLVEFTRVPRDAMTERRLEVHKFRGSDFVDGRHSMRITGEGLVVFPRFEAMHGDPPEHDPDGGRVSSGIADLDLALHDGVPAATSTLVLGPSGAGKTSLGLHFLAPSSAAEPGLLFGFYETPPRLRGKARALGLPLDAAIEAGHLELVWQAPTERQLDALGQRLLEAVRRQRARRVVVDGIGGFLESASEPERLKRFFAALANALRAEGATTLFTVEAQRLFGTEVDLPMQGVSAVAENMLLLRMVELRGRLRRSLAILKVRDSAFENSLMEVAITRTGIVLTPGAFQSAESVTTGVAHVREGGG